MSVVFALPGILSFSQNLIGYNYNEIKKYMKENYREMNFDKVTNSKFWYLKYSDNSDSQTLLFFLDTDSLCKSVKITCDFNIQAKLTKEFNARYLKRSDNLWIDSRNGKDYLIEIKNEKWYYSITMETAK